MNIDIQTESSTTNQTTSSRPPAGLALVRCEGFTCLAFRDADGRWISYFDRKEVTNVLEVMTSVAQSNQF
jgi:hypothetical protein